MVKENTVGLMENSILVNFIRIQSKDMEYVYFLMENNIKECGIKENYVVQVFLSKVISNVSLIKMENCMNGLSDIFNIY